MPELVAAMDDSLPLLVNEFMLRIKALGKTRASGKEHMGELHVKYINCVSFNLFVCLLHVKQKHRFSI